MNETTKAKPPLNPLPTSSEQAKRKRVEQDQKHVAKRKKAEEHLSVVREIQRKKDYYDILGLGKNSTAEDIHKAYRKLSLKVHPDKNGTPGAEDSFKKLSNAFQCLSNAERRRKYDLFQTRSPAVSRSSRAFRPVATKSVPRSSGAFRTRQIVIQLIFRPDASVVTMLGPRWTMKELMMVARARAVEMFKLTGSFRLKYQFKGEVIFLPKEDAS